jgi:hypothetical protein
VSAYSRADEEIDDGNCNVVQEQLEGTVSQHKKYDPPFQLPCGIYLSKIVIWQDYEELPYRGYVTPATQCYVNGQPIPCSQVRKNDRVRADFDRKANSETRGLLIRVDVTR